MSRLLDKKSGAYRKVSGTILTLAYEKTQTSLRAMYAHAIKKRRKVVELERTSSTLAQSPLSRKHTYHVSQEGSLTLAAITAKPFLNSSAGRVALGTDRVPCGKSPTQMPLFKRSPDCSRHCCIVPFLPRLIMMPPHSAVMAPNPGINLVTGHFRHRIR